MYIHVGDVGTVASPPCIYINIEIYIYIYNIYIGDAGTVVSPPSGSACAAWRRGHGLRSGSGLQLHG